MTGDQACEIIALLRKSIEVQEGVASELAYFVQYIRERDSYPRSVRVESNSR